VTRIARELISRANVTSAISRAFVCAPSRLSRCYGAIGGRRIYCVVSVELKSSGI